MNLKKDVMVIKMIKKCKNCEKSFETVNKGNKRLYCSDKCAENYWKSHNYLRYREINKIATNKYRNNNLEFYWKSHNLMPICVFCHPTLHKKNKQ